MAKGGRGIRLTILALQPYGGTAYAVARVRAVAQPGNQPQDAAEVFQNWWKYADPKREVVHSDVTRKLPRAPYIAPDTPLDERMRVHFNAHTEKIIEACVQRKVNILVYPDETSGKRAKRPAERWVQEVADKFAALSHYDKTVTITHPLQQYQRWLLEQFPDGGGSFNLRLPGKPWPNALVPGWSFISSGPAQEAMARIYRWLDKYQYAWEGNLMVFRETKKEYMEEMWKKPRPTHDESRRLSKNELKKEDFRRHGDVVLKAKNPLRGYRKDPT